MGRGETGKRKDPSRKKHEDNGKEGIMASPQLS